MKIVYKVDLDGFYLEEIIINDTDKLPLNCVTKKPQDGLFKPRYVNGEWVEFLSQEEINNKFKPSTQPSEIEILGEQLVEKDIQIMELQSINDMLGRQIVDLDIRLMIGGL